MAVADNVDETNTGNCPSRPGDGLCVATTWAGMASGKIPARTLLLVATQSGDVLGSKNEKSRHREVAVVALVDGERLLREDGDGANLSGANLSGANLSRANLSGANLSDGHYCSSTLTQADRGALTARGAIL